MRRFLRTAVPMMLILFLCACGKEQTTQQALDFRTSLLSKPEYTYTAEVTADYQDRVYSFTTNCRCDPDGETSVSLTAPETIAGIAATVGSDCKTVQFDDLSLEFGTLADGKVSAVCLPAVLNACWTSAYIDSVGSDDGNPLVVYRVGYDADELLVRCWFDGETKLPIYAEICSDDTAALRAAITNFQDT